MFGLDETAGLKNY